MTQTRGRPEAKNARFAGYVPDPTTSRSLAPDHQAAVDGRTIFPGNLVSPMESKRLLVSGANNGKIGKVVLKGPWTGMPIYTLTLEERATCPRSCAQWLTCFGNAMHWPNRNDAGHEDFLPALAAEVITTARRHPEGMVVRLHVLGDFFSPAYVMFWARLLEMLPGLHVYGYTARRVDTDGAESRKIAVALQVLTTGLWSRFAVRTSHVTKGRDRTIVVDCDPEDPDVIVCPASTESTDNCATCGLCWSPNMRNKTIAFIRHGMKRPGRPKKHRPRLGGFETDPGPLATPHAQPRAITGRLMGDPDPDRFARDQRLRAALRLN